MNDFVDNIHNPAEQVGDWKIAQRLLEDGYKRYIENRGIMRNTNARDREILKDGQKPVAAIVTCSDSRVSPEIYFDQKLGDIFVVRNAGNIADATALGSIEYAVTHLKVPLVVVVGHSRCGAVKGALNSGEYSENLQTIISTIRSATKDSDTLEDAVHANIDSAVNRISENNIVKRMGAKVIGAYYNVESGELFWEGT
jgi:carbonic anhydrase